MFNLQDLR